LAHSVDAFLSHSGIDQVIVVFGAGQLTLAEQALQGRAGVRLVEGGPQRQDSVAAGLAIVTKQCVLIHDAARPFLSAGVIDRLIAALETSDGVVLVLPVVDTLARSEGALGDTVDRSQVVRVQTPQAFHTAAIRAAHARWQSGPATDDAQMARAAGFVVATIEGDPALEKITHPDDFARAERFLEAQMISRTGMGYDVHRLADNEELWLCGVLIPHDQGLVGHSDADVALHALVDALLGAIAEGDIGSHFPPGDPQWRGAASARFVEHARDLIAAKGGIIDHVDLTLICEAPKIGPHRDIMRARLAALLRIPMGSVSIKATTTERLGFAGRGEGIAAQAVATVRARRNE
jgi:2-C-methyl-D-erythritol 4-phosphate cytidylyltransferase/2-C-methyl-D-erythritol 2,4-cyclodiphosphate synthase